MNSSTRTRKCGVRRLCGHCNQWLITPVYKQHRHDFFDSVSNFWHTKDIASSSESDCETEHVGSEETSAVFTGQVESGP